MQKSVRNEGQQRKRAMPFIVKRACPQCGNDYTRPSSTKSSDGLLNSLFRKSYRCQECGHRFWLMDRSRLIWFTCIILVLASIIGFFGIILNKQSAVPNSSQIAYYDQIKSLAEKGDAEAELQMGLRYTSIADEKIAAQWFEKAAQHGKVLAQYRYGLALLKGQGVVQDYKKASYWLEKAARKGNAEAQFSLGEMYHSDMGIIKDNPALAYLWFNLAAAQGLEKAASARDLVVQMLTRDQIAAMQEEANRISQNQYSGPVVSESEAELKENLSGVAGKSTTKVSEPKGELKKYVPGGVDKPSANKPIPAYRYSGQSIRRKKVDSKENVPGIADNQNSEQKKRKVGSTYFDRIARWSKLKSNARVPRVEENPSTNRTMSGLNSPVPGIYGSTPGVTSTMSGVVGPMPQGTNPMPGGASPMSGINGPVPAVKKPKLSLIGPIPKGPIQNEKLPPVKY